MRSQCPHYYFVQAIILLKLKLEIIIKQFLEVPFRIRSAVLVGCYAEVSFYIFAEET